MFHQYPAISTGSINNKGSFLIINHYSLNLFLFIFRNPTGKRTLPRHQKDGKTNFYASQYFNMKSFNILKVFATFKECRFGSNNCHESRNSL